MSDEQKAREDEVFDQELSLDDLDAAAGGIDCGDLSRILPWQLDDQWDADKDNCTRDHYRQVYGGSGFPNCAATVEDGSWCGTNDACKKNAIEYKGMGDCSKAWR